MKLFQITYYAAEIHHHEHGESCNHDQEEHHHHHSNIPRKIQSLGSWANIMPTTLLVHTEMSASEIKLSLDEVKQDNEIFFVSEITENNAGSMHPGALAFIENKLK